MPPGDATRSARPACRQGQRRPRRGRWGLAVLIVTAAAIVGARSPWAEEPRLALRNASTVDVTAVMVSPDYRLHWGANLIGGATIGPGSERWISLPDDDGHCFYDILVEDSAGRQQPNFNQNLCSNPVYEYREE